MVPRSLFQRAHDVDADERRLLYRLDAMRRSRREIRVRPQVALPRIALNATIERGPGSLLIEAIRTPFTCGGKAQDACAEVRGEDSGRERVSEGGARQGVARVELLGGPFNRAAPGQRDLSRERV
jgi:hypothetical protein